MQPNAVVVLHDSVMGDRTVMGVIVKINTGIIIPSRTGCSLDREPAYVHVIPCHFKDVIARI